MLKRAGARRENGPAAGIGAARDRRRSRARAVARRAARLLAERFGARRVVLIGSLAEGERFGFHSDIDLGVAGLPPRRYFQAAGELQMLGGEFDIDLIPFEGATVEMEARLRHGEVLHDQG